MQSACNYKIKTYHAGKKQKGGWILPNEKIGFLHKVKWTEMFYNKEVSFKIYK